MLICRERLSPMTVCCILRSCPSLYSLNLAETAISDEALPAFASSLQLKTLAVGDTKVSAQGLIELNTLLSGRKAWQSDDVVPPSTYDLEIWMSSGQFFRVGYP